MIGSFAGMLGRILILVGATRAKLMLEDLIRRHFWALWQFLLRRLRLLDHILDIAVRHVQTIPSLFSVVLDFFLRGCL